MSPKLMRAQLDAPMRTEVAWPAVIVLVFAGLIALFGWGWTRGYDARVLAHMPRTERETLFHLTRSKAEALCGNLELEDRCRAEVELLSKFPECGLECQEFVARHRPRASR